MKTGILGIAVVCVLAMASPLRGQGAKMQMEIAPALPTRVLAVVDDQLIPALNDGNDIEFYECYLSLIEKKQNRLAEIEKHCMLRGLSSPRKHFVDLLSHNMDREVVEDLLANLKVATVFANELNDRASRWILEANAHPIFKDPTNLPNNWKDSEQFFWELHVQANELANLTRGMEELDRAISSLHSNVKSTASEETFANLAIQKAKLSELQIEFRERSIAARVARFNRSNENFNATEDFESRFIANLEMQLDGEIIQKYLTSQNGKPSKLALLNRLNLAEQIQDKLELSLQDKDNVAEKAVLFRNGLHYWLRGRYGEGPLANGLLKHPSAMNSVQAMEGLFMPRERPTPISLYLDESKSGPGYDRRHFATWAVEWREFRISSDSTSQQIETSYGDKIGYKKSEKFW